MGSQPSLFSSSTPQNDKALTVSELNQGIKSQLESEFSLVWVKAEISNFKAHSSGHYYFSLKDSSSQISAVMFRGQNSRLNFRPKDGLEVLVRGRVSVYAPRGSYQILCEKMQPVGVGGLKEEFEKLKLKLKSEGLFDLEHKKPLPYLPFKIALVTSPTSAAVRDMIQVLSRRHPAAELIVVPCLTQGEKASSDIIRALGEAETLEGVEVVLLSRGGGSLEDMWCFNDEALARKIFSMKLPVVSGVGHEIDFSIADFVADFRAPTPSAAAEIVCKNVEEIKERNQQSKRRFWLKLQSLLKNKKMNLSHLSKRLIDPRRKLEEKRIRLDDLSIRAERALAQKLKYKQDFLVGRVSSLFRFEESFAPRKKDLGFLQTRLKSSFIKSRDSKLYKLKVLQSKMEALSPFQVLERGYSIVKDPKTGKIIRKSSEVSAGQILNLKLSKGDLDVKVIKES